MVRRKQVAAKEASVPTRPRRAAAAISDDSNSVNSEASSVHNKKAESKKRQIPRNRTPRKSLDFDEDDESVTESKDSKNGDNEWKVEEGEEEEEKKAETEDEKDAEEEEVDEASNRDEGEEEEPANDESEEGSAKDNESYSPEQDDEDDEGSKGKRGGAVKYKSKVKTPKKETAKSPKKSPNKSRLIAKLYDDSEESEVDSEDGSAVRPSTKRGGRATVNGTERSPAKRNETPAKRVSTPRGAKSATRAKEQNGVGDNVELVPETPASCRKSPRTPNKSFVESPFPRRNLFSDEEEENDEVAVPTVPSSSTSRRSRSTANDNGADSPKEDNSSEEEDSQSKAKGRNRRTVNKTKAKAVGRNTPNRRGRGGAAGAAKTESDLEESEGEEEAAAPTSRSARAAKSSTGRNGLIATKEVDASDEEEDEQPVSRRKPPQKPAGRKTPNRRGRGGPTTSTKDESGDDESSDGEKQDPPKTTPRRLGRSSRRAVEPKSSVKKITTADKDSDSESDEEDEKPLSKLRVGTSRGARASGRVSVQSATKRTPNGRVKATVDEESIDDENESNEDEPPKKSPGRSGRNSRQVKGGRQRGGARKGRKESSEEEGEEEEEEEEEPKPSRSRRFSKPTQVESSSKKAAISKGGRGKAQKEVKDDSDDSMSVDSDRNDKGRGQKKAAVSEPQPKKRDGRRQTTKDEDKRSNGTNSVDDFSDELNSSVSDVEADAQKGRKSKTHPVARTNRTRGKTAARSKYVEVNSDSDAESVDSGDFYAKKKTRQRYDRRGRSLKTEGGVRKSARAVAKMRYREDYTEVSSDDDTHYVPANKRNRRDWKLEGKPVVVLKKLNPRRYR